MIVADIMTAEADVADLAFLVATLLAVVAAVLHLSRHPATASAGAAVLAFAVAAVAFGLLAL